MTTHPAHLRFSMCPRRRQRGIALFIGLVFLVVLSLVAVIAMQSTLMEMHMSTNVARHEEAFQVSESMRSLVGPFVDQNMYNAGWPVSYGGTVPDNDFDWSAINASLVTMFFTALDQASNPPKNLYTALDPGEDPFNPTTWLTDLGLLVTDPNHPTDQLLANLSFVPDGTVVNKGSGAAQAGAYRGLGTGVGAGGSARFLEIQSVGLSPSGGTNGRSNTISQYRAVLH